MKTFEEKANDLIGKEYETYGANCWDLVMELVPDAPSVQESADNLAKSVRTFKKEVELHNAEEVKILYNKDIVLMGRDNEVFFHAGVYYEGGVIHASLNGVVYEPIDSIKRQYNSVKGFRV